MSRVGGTKPFLTTGLSRTQESNLTSKTTRTLKKYTYSAIISPVLHPYVPAHIHWLMLEHQTFCSTFNHNSNSTTKIRDVYTSLFASDNSYCNDKTVHYCQTMGVWVRQDTVLPSNIYWNLCWEKPAVVLPHLTALLSAFESLTRELLCPRGPGNFPCLLAWGIIE